MVKNYWSTDYFGWFLEQDTPQLWGKLILRHWHSINFIFVHFFKLKWLKFTKVLISLGKFLGQDPPQLWGKLLLRHWHWINFSLMTFINHFSLKKKANLAFYGILVNKTKIHWVPLSWKQLSPSLRSVLSRKTPKLISASVIFDHFILKKGKNGHLNDLLVT